MNTDHVKTMGRSGKTMEVLTLPGICRGKAETGDNYTDNMKSLIHHQPGKKYLAHLLPVRTPFTASSSPAPSIMPAGKFREKREIQRKALLAGIKCSIYFKTSIFRKSMSSNFSLALFMRAFAKGCPMMCTGSWKAAPFPDRHRVATAAFL